jgi:hypothetical protein
MRSLSYELIKQVAIFTLNNDLKLSSEEINRFILHFEENVDSIGSEMLKIQEEAKANITCSKDPKYIEH